MGNETHNRNPGTTSSLSRRKLLQFGAASAAAGALALRVPVVTLAKPLAASERDAFGFIVGVLNARCQAVLMNSGSKLRALYDGTNREALAFELERVARLYHMAHDQWHGRHSKVYSQVESFTISAQDAGAYEVKVREILCFDWFYDPIPVPAAIEADRRRQPDFAARAAISLVNSDGSFPQRWGIDHAFTIAPRNNGFIVQTHAYEELFIASPDAGGGRRSYPGYYGDTNSSAPLTAPGTAEPQSDVYMAGGAPGARTGLITPYTMTNGVNYAIAWRSNRNCSTYADWSPPRGGGDCANFVSQCLYAGGIPTSSSWNRGVWGAHECKAGSGNWPNNYDGSSNGTYNWTANDRLRNWLLSSGHGSDASPNFPWTMQAGDCFSYDWTGDGHLDHITYVTQTPTSSQPCYVASHTADGNYVWNKGGAARYYGTHVFYV